MPPAEEGAGEGCCWYPKLSLIGAAVVAHLPADLALEEAAAVVMLLSLIHCPPPQYCAVVVLAAAAARS